jgi:trehalose 6-phosphate phosphatase
MAFSYHKIATALDESKGLCLFLDYDGTLADFSDSPEKIEPVKDVIRLLTALRDEKCIRAAVVSGRRLAHLRNLIPIEGITLAGTYGIEILDAEGNTLHQAAYTDLRPTLEKIKPIWQALIEDNQAFFLEDKGWSLALHARFVEDSIAADRLEKAKKSAHILADNTAFQIIPGHKFLEVSPVSANKGNCVRSLLNMYPPAEDDAIIYMGDDDKDEQAFKVVHEAGGWAIRVCSNVINEPIEDWRIEDPAAARAWLWSLLDQFSN